MSVGRNWVWIVVVDQPPLVEQAGIVASALRIVDFAIESMDPTYTYAGLGQQAVLSQSVSSGTDYSATYGKTDQNGNPTIVTYTGGTSGAHVYSDPITGQALMLTTSSDVSALYVWDGLGNPVGLLTDFSTNSFSYAYDPYGTRALTAGGTGSGTGQNPYSFKAGIQDRGTGLVKFGLRWYEPTTGTWTQQDTLDAPLSPSDANRYGYSGQDPVNVSDPTGLYGYTTPYCSSSIGCSNGRSYSGPTEPAYSVRARACATSVLSIVVGGIPRSAGAIFGGILGAAGTFDSCSRG